MQYIQSVPTSLLAAYLHHRFFSLHLVSQNIFLQKTSLKPYSVQHYTAFLIVCYLMCGLNSRPLDYSKWKKVGTFLDSYTSKSSGIQFYPDLFTFDNGNRIVLQDCLDCNVISSLLNLESNFINNDYIPSNRRPTINIQGLNFETLVSNPFNTPSINTLTTPSTINNNNLLLNLPPLLEYDPTTPVHSFDMVIDSWRNRGLSIEFIKSLLRCYFQETWVIFDNKRGRPPRDYISPDFTGEIQLLDERVFTERTIFDSLFVSNS